MEVLEQNKYRIFHGEMERFTEWIRKEHSDPKETYQLSPVKKNGVYIRKDLRNRSQILKLRLFFRVEMF